MSRIDIENLLDRYLKGTASPEEIERVEIWLANNGNTNSQWQQMDHASKDEWLNGLFNQIQEDINQPKVVTMPPRRNLWRSIAAVAAVLAVFFTAYVEWPAIQNFVHPVQLTALNVSIDQTKQVILADGSKIWVNGGSQLKYPESFNSKTREVYLSGEAYFDIQHDAAKPFIIHTGKVITTVLGTAFDIKEDKILHTVVVTVTRGKVSVANGKQVLGTITPNQQISFNTNNNQHIKTDVDAKQTIAWQKNELHFEDITFADAVGQLQLKFKVKIAFGNNRLKNCRFTGTALDGEKLDKILKVVCAFNNATYQTQPDGSIIINGPGCN
ncbi:MAG TPA: FecR domain-containing protein [Mucilaginibacter sp.]|jgi:ferric-dicitrate binding protein FerR (iron transport regulator)